MEKARCNTELYSNLRALLNNVKPSNFWGSHQFDHAFYSVLKVFLLCKTKLLHQSLWLRVVTAEVSVDNSLILSSSSRKNILKE